MAKLTPISLAVAASLGSSMVNAQEEHESGGFSFEEIVVTAQRREESLQEAAIPINAATGEQLAKAGINNAIDLGRISPSLYINNGGGANLGYFVRGVGNFNNNGYTNPAVAFNLDGVYMGRPSSTNMTFLDLGRVEVLKGPQGTLYGRNATGGAINVHPNKPELGVNGGSVSANVGNFGKVQLTGILNVAAGDTSALRIAASADQLDGWFDDGTGETDDKSFRIQFYSEPSESFNYRLSADYSKSEGNGAGIDVTGVYGFVPSVAGGGNLPIPNWDFTPSPSNVDEFDGLHSPDTLAFIEDNATAAPLFSPINGYSYPFRNDSSWGVSGEFNFDLGFADLVVIPSYRHSELDNQFNGPPFRAAINQDEAKQTSIEARLSGETDSLHWILGAYYFDESVDGKNSFNQFSTLSANDWTSEVESEALFGRATFSVTDRFRLVAGARYTVESRSMDAKAWSVAGICLGGEGTPGPPNCSGVPTLPVGVSAEDSLSQIDPALFPIPGTNPLDALDSLFPIADPNNPNTIFSMYGPAPGYAAIAVTPTEVDQSDDDSKTTYRVAAEFDAGESSLLYVSYETGFRAGGYNLSFGKETFEGEEIDAFTLGSKNRFMDDRLELNFEAFLWQYEDQILAALGVDDRGGNSFYARNVGESTISGLEVDFQILVAKNTRIRGGLQLLDTEYDSFSYNQVDLSDDSEDPPNFLTPLTGCDYVQVVQPGSTIAGAPGVVVDPNAEAIRSYDIDCSGKESLFSPDTSANLGIDQTFSVGNGVITASLDLRYRSERWVGFGFHPGQQAKSVGTIDASVGYENDQGWSILLYGRNLGDKYIPATFQVGAGNVAIQSLEPPRTYGLQVNYDF